MSVNKAELIDRLAERLEVTKKDAGEIVDAVIDEIQGAVAKGEKVALTGEEVKIKATSLPKFRPGAEFKSAVAGAKKAPAKKAPAKKAPAKKAAAKK